MTIYFNSLPFSPNDPQHVKMYVCGPTVYDVIHIGNARPIVIFDTLYRLLLTEYPRVSYVRNITDIDDKIIAAAKGPIEVLTNRTIQQFHEDTAALNALPPTLEPRATEHIPQMISMIERLISLKHAYVLEQQVLFDIRSYPEYGKLSGNKVGLKPADFVLWKPSTLEQPGWESPWGRGRPGWHIECSAMIKQTLGDTIDIHGGGLDLLFPHHENETAQSCCANGAPLANYWLHNGHVRLNGEKMSKSTGNHKTVRELLGAGWSGEEIRLSLLGTHYRHPMDFTESRLRTARSALRKWKRSSVSALGSQETLEGVKNALRNDLNTPNAISVIHKACNDGLDVREAVSLLLGGPPLPSPPLHQLKDEH